MPMKKIILPIFAIAVLASACKKERSCKCSIKSSGGSYGMTIGETEKTAEKQTKKYFRENSRCYNSVTTAADPNDPSMTIKTETTCTLK